MSFSIPIFVTRDVILSYQHRECGPIWAIRIFYFYVYPRPVLLYIALLYRTYYIILPIEIYMF
jgi:hypothetical protein